MIDESNFTTDIIAKCSAVAVADFEPPRKAANSELSLPGFGSGTVLALFPYKPERHTEIPYDYVISCAACFVEASGDNLYNWSGQHRQLAKPTIIL